MEDADKLSAELSQSLERADRLMVTVSLGETKAEFSGAPEIVLQSINSFISKSIPEIDLAKKLAMNFSTKDLVEKFQNFVRITPEGPRVLTEQTKLSDKEVIGLQLVAQRIASETRPGVTPWLTLSILQERTSLIPKTLSSRLSELSKSGYVSKEIADDKSQFKISTIGIDWLSGLLSKK